MPVGTYT